MSQTAENERLLETNETRSNYGSIRSNSGDGGILKKTILCASLFSFFGIMWGHFSSQIPVTKENLGISNRHFGLLLLFDDLGSFIGQAIATRFPALLRSTLLTPLIGSCVVSAVGLSNLSRTPKQFGASTLTSGILASLFDIAINIQIVTLGAITGRADAPFFHGLFSAGQLIGSGLGTLMTRLAVPFDLRVIGMTSTLAVIYLLHFPIVRLSGQLRIEREEGENDAGSIDASDNNNDNQITTRQTIKTKILILAAVGFFSSVCEGSLSEWAGIYLRQNLNTSFSIANSAAFAYSLGMTVARFIGTWAARKIGLKAVMIWGSLMASIAMFIGLALNDKNAFLVSLVFAAIGLANITPLSMAFLSSFAADKQAISVAKISLAQQIGFFGGPVIIGNVSGLIGLRLALVLLPFSSLAIMVCTIPLDISTG